MERAKTWENMLQAVRSCQQLQLWDDARIIICGDFNMVELDTDSTTLPSLISSQEKCLWNEILDSLNCKDLWGFIGGHTLRYTFHSRSHRKAMSRLDRCYFSHVYALSPVSEMWVDSTILLSDHNPLLLSMFDSNWTASIPDRLHRIPLRLNHVWIRTSVFKAKVDILIQQVFDSELSASLKWEALVVGMQGVIQDCGKYFSGVLKAAKAEAEQVILSLTEKVDMGCLLSERDYSHLCDAYRCLHFIENNAINSAKVRMDVNDLHATSKCFYDFLRAKRAANTISSLQTEGKELRDGNSIADACSNHYRNSYSTNESWFASLHEALAYTPQCLDSRTATTCESSITEEEIFLALGSLKNGKAPGLDGLTKEFILAFWLSDPFSVQRSVHQRCPLSPLFYAMASTPMFYLLQAKMESGYIHGISVHETQHIAVGFADDTFIFAKACEDNLQNILASLNPFSKASALNINMGKSTLINISARHFHFPSWQGNKIERGVIFRHLGYPLGCNVSTKEQIQWVICRMKSKLNVWHAMQWPLYTRIRIVQSFLQPYIMYYLLLLDWKKSHLYIFDCFIKNFLWNKAHNRALSKGGLGILHLHSHMLARQAAFIMRITSIHKPLWTDVFWKIIENVEVYYKGSWKLSVWIKFFLPCPASIFISHANNASQEFQTDGFWPEMEWATMLKRQLGGTQDFQLYGTHPLLTR
ncbi:hypothetical protein KP509_34G052500 [Ceratopteris richardii]|uniref:Reverse transcriptase domain-containing protein n=1 Tax=Ceratopteris richardii TaxID=49495 RepID=A0A8T2QJZ4_CERRI|nr:hypothetical protein KP509_34G052500 [Ceratopteris richardii]